jgi:hypothetical protein
MSPLRVSLLTLFVAGSAFAMAEAQNPRKQTAPETFNSSVQARTEIAASATTMRIQIDTYTKQQDADVMSSALAHGGYSGFLQALRQASAAGHLVLGPQTFTIRWARQEPTAKGGRAITLVTDAPIYFIGGGRTDAKPRAGFELAVVRLAVDDFGLGTGTMAAAAKVRPNGDGGVIVDDYADEPIKLTFVHRVVK